jgi:hypothetical protein
MKRITLLSFAVVTVLALAAWATPRALADDDDDDHAEIKITAPLEAVDCAGGSIVVLGLSIDIHNATLRGDDCDDDDDDDEGEDEHDDDLMNNDDDDDDDDQGDCRLACEDLVAGQAVEVRMASDIPPLVATEVRVESGDDDDDDEDLLNGSDEEEVEIEAPIQAIDEVGRTIRVLGLTVNVGGAEIEGEDDCEHDDDDEDDDLATGSLLDDDDCEVQAGFEDLIVGQFVEVELASSLPPFSATEVEIEDFSNQVEVDVEAPDGEDLEEIVASSLSDFTISIKTRVKIQKRSGGRTVTRVLRLQAPVEGSHFMLSGLPPGPAKIEIEGLGGTGLLKGKTKVRIRNDETVAALVRLKPRGH